jgi:hypothetical protein
MRYASIRDKIPPLTGGIAFFDLGGIFIFQGQPTENDYEVFLCINSASQSENFRMQYERAGGNPQVVVSRADAGAASSRVTHNTCHKSLEP